MTRVRRPDLWRKDYRRAINLLIGPVRAVERGEWKPTPADELLLDGLRKFLADKEPRP